MAARRPITKLSDAALQTVWLPRATTEKAVGEAIGVITTGMRVAAGVLGWATGKARRAGGTTAAPGLSVVEGGSSARARPRAPGNGKPMSTTPAERAPRNRTTTATPPTTTTKRTTTRRAGASKSATKRPASRTTTRPAASNTATKQATAKTAATRTETKTAAKRPTKRAVPLPSQATPADGAPMTQAREVVVPQGRTPSDIPAAEEGYHPNTAETHVAPAKKAAGQRSRGERGPSAATIRQWAQEQGIEVSARGRVPGAVRDRYLAAH